MTVSGISFDPILAWPLLAALAALALVLCALALWRGLGGWHLRALAALALLAALANPSWNQEQRDPQDDVVFIVADETSSQSIAPRPDQMQQAMAALTSRIAAFGKAQGEAGFAEPVIVHVPDGTGPDADRGSRVMSALAAAMGETAPDRIAGAIILSDGRIDDAEVLPGFPAPVHHLITGLPDEWDRRILVETAPAYAIVGEPFELAVRVEVLGAQAPQPGERVPVFLSVDGDEPRAFSVPPGETFRIPLELAHGGPNVLQLIVPDAEGELTAQNNQAILSVNGIRDRLRVLLVSGEPYAGERTWRNLLKSDPAVDLVHFTILRPPSKQDGVPVFELSLIAFPTRELFMDKIEEFDLIIFDRYRNREVLPNLYLENIVNYVRGGGALLLASGSAFAGPESLFRSPLGEILPAEPTGQIFEEGFVPKISETGQRHPVTEGLEALAPRPPAKDGTPGWGRWFRLIDTEPTRGQVVMTGAEDRPLLVLDRFGEGRVAQLASDEAWLWSRGYEGGGPQLELLRRLAHWLMKEPELEEETLTAESDGAGLTITRRSLGDVPPEVSVTAPDGTKSTVVLAEVGPGKWHARFEAPANGLYRITNGDISTVAAVGPAAPREFVNALATPEILAPLVDATGGGSFRLSDGLPDIRRVREGRVAAGDGWLGLVSRGAYRVTDIRLIPLAPPWLMLALAALLSLAAWRREGR